MEENELTIVCRVCMTDEGVFQSIFMTDDTAGVAIHLAEMIMAYASVQITLGDGLPDQICMKCSEKVAQFYLFKLKCEETDMILRSKINRSPIYDPIEEQHYSLDLEHPDEVIIKPENSPIFEEETETIEIIENVVDPTEIEIIDKADEIEIQEEDNWMEESQETKLFECDVCSKCFTRNDILVRHKRTHEIKLEVAAHEEHDDEDDEEEEEEEIEALDNQCVLCNIIFENEDQYEMHMITQHTEESKDGAYSCTICNKSFVKSYRLNRHMKIHSVVKPYVCSQCGKSYARAEQLTNHLNTHSGVKPHVCKICSKGFNQTSNLKDHMRTHNGEKPFLCSTCGKGFNQLGNLRQHTIRHSGIKAHLCSVCGNGFASKGELGAHLRKHTGARPFVCSVCNHGFTTSSSLTKHKRIHSGEKPYECEVCKMKFSRSGILARHKRTHTGEKPYVCKFCSKAFSQSNDLSAHLRIHTGEKPFICDTCGQAFRQSSALKTHKKTHDRPSKVVIGMMHSTFLS